MVTASRGDGSTRSFRRATSMKLDLRERRLQLEERGVELELFSASQPPRSDHVIGPACIELKLKRDVTIPPATESFVPVKRGELRTDVCLHGWKRRRVGPTGGLVAAVQMETLNLEPDLPSTGINPDQMRAEQQMDPEVSPVRTALISDKELSTAAEEAPRPDSITETAHPETAHSEAAHSEAESSQLSSSGDDSDDGGGGESPEHTRSSTRPWRAALGGPLPAQRTPHAP
ncbi:hypothetical protein FJT64_012015 [Amphibalanus amphitrite]|uniref:Uncharacterized protein n=1 Tax=Amphibalanus amphitrite TaxID=1232801 RepID=A0A6A4V7W9_AMPAM|nr:hypothetical protein FJT64_012015 [Amphibalanus amphitrite]